MKTRRQPDLRDSPEQFSWPPSPEELDAMEMVYLHQETPQRVALTEPQQTPAPARRGVVLPYAIAAGLAIVAGAGLAEYHVRTARAHVDAVATPADRSSDQPAPIVPPDAPPASARASRRESSAGVLRGTPSTMTRAASVAKLPPGLPPISRTAPSNGLPDAGAEIIVSPIAPPRAAATTPAPTSVVGLPLREDERSIRQILARYTDAYAHLDAAEAAELWPSLDIQALSRAFAGLRMVSIEFDHCDLSLGHQTATAICSGSTRTVRRIGSQTPVTEAHYWTFRFWRTKERWAIDSIAVSPQ